MTRLPNATRNRIQIALLALTAVGFLYSARHAHDLPVAGWFTVSHVVHAPAFMPDGRSLRLAAEPLYAVGGTAAARRHMEPPTELWDWRVGLPAVDGAGVALKYRPAPLQGGGTPSPDGRYIAGIDVSGAVRLLDTAGTGARTLIPAPKQGRHSPPRQVGFGPDGRTVFVADREHGGARFFDADTGAPVPAPDGVDTVSPSLLASAPDGSRLAAYGADGLIHLLPNRPSGTAAVAPLRPQMRNVHDLFWLDGGRFLVAVGVNHAPAGESPLAAVQLPTAQVWDLSGAGRDCVFTGRKRTAWRFGHGGWVFVTDRTPPLGDFAPRTTRNREVRHEARLLDLRSGQEWVLPGAETTFLDCAFSDDGRYLATVAVFAPTLGVAVVSPMPPRQVTVWRLPDRR